MEKSNLDRILIVGNSGSGKSWLATQLSEMLTINTIHFDKHFWEPGGFNTKRDKQVVYQEIKSLAQEKNWIMEGVFGELAELALERATLFIFLDKTWDECREALLSRGSESSKQLDSFQAEENFKQLLIWAENYWLRSDPRSKVGHQLIFEKAKCQKLLPRNRDEMTSLLSSLK